MDEIARGVRGGRKCICLPLSAQAAGSHRSGNSADLAASRESVVRELLKSAQAARRGSHRSGNSTDLAASRESVVRELFRSCDGAVIPGDTQ